MKKITIKIIYIVSLTTVLFSTACNDVFNVVTELTTNRLFQPINFSQTTVKTKVTFSWVATNNAQSYKLLVSTDSLNFENTLVLDTTVTGLSYSQEFEGNKQYFARLRANATDSLKNSKYNILAFKTPKENVFDGFGTKNNTGDINGNTIYSAYMTDVKTLDIKWQPGVNATHLILTSADGTQRDSISLIASEIATGEKIINSLQNSNWKVQIYNNKIIRGTTYGLIEGDIIISSPGDISAALVGAGPGQVVLLSGGANAVYTIGSAAFIINSNIKIRGTSPTDRPVICMTSGTPTATSNMLGLGSLPIGNISMENIDFTGYCDNSPLATKVGYLFNNGTAAKVSNMSFTNCKLRNFGNTPFRLKNGAAQVIDTLTINGCIINDIGFASTYAIINSNSNDLFNTIVIANSTIYNFKGSLILRTGQTLNSINISNCNINQGMQDPVSARYLLDLNTATFTGTGVTIKNCIFGTSGLTVGANGIRGTVVPTFTNNYFTSDYVDDPIPAGLTSTSIKSKLSSYAGKSTDLWSSPLTGDFSLKDTNFAGKGTAGDLRW